MTTLPVRLTCLLALGTLFTTFTACHFGPPMEDYQTEKFELNAAPGAADGYPVQIHRGEFSNSLKQGRIVVPYGDYLESTWGGSGIAWGVGDPMQPVPDSLHLRWFAWAENQFYEGHFAMPQRKIYDLLKQGYWKNDEKKHETYGTLLVCVLPKGGVVVWLQGRNQVLIGRFQAPATNYSWLAFNGGHDSNRAQVVAEYQREMLPQVRAEIAAGTISSRKWDAYLAAVYPWKLEVRELDGKQPIPVPVTNYFMRFVNAESVTYAPTPDRTPYVQGIITLTPKPVPKYFGVFVKNRYGEQHEVRVDSLDEAETLAAFHTLATSQPKEPIVLRVEVDKLYTQATLTLSNGFQTIPLPKAVAKVFEL